MCENLTPILLMILNPIELVVRCNYQVAGTRWLIPTLSETHNTNGVMHAHTSRDVFILVIFFLSISIRPVSHPIVSSSSLVSDCVPFCPLVISLYTLGVSPFHIHVNCTGRLMVHV